MDEARDQRRALPRSDRRRHRRATAEWTRHRTYPSRLARGRGLGRPHAPWPSICWLSGATPRLLGAVRPGARGDQAPDLVPADRAHLVVDREVDAGPQPRLPCLRRPLDQIGLVARKEVAQDRRRRRRDRRVAGRVGEERGVGIRTSRVGSAVIGRAVQEANLASQQQTKASATATLVSARTRAACGRSSASRAIRSRAISIQSPAGVTVPGPPARKRMGRREGGIP